MTGERRGMRTSRLLTTGEVARLSGFSPSAVLQWIRSGKLESYSSPGGQHRVTPEQLMCFQFAGFEIPFDSPDMGDAVGELANIFAGEVKGQLDSRGVRCDISLPTVLRGGQLEVLKYHQLPGGRWNSQTPAGNLWAGVVTGSSVVATQLAGM